MAKGNWFGFSGELPPNMELLQLILGKWVNQAIYAAAELGIADQLKDGPRPSADVATDCGTDDDATYRLMRALSNIGVLDEREERTFALTPVGEFLRSDVPGSLRGMARFMGYDPTWTAWGQAVYSVRSGKPAFEHVFKENIFDWYAKHLDESAVFDEAMTAISTVESNAVADAFDFSGIGTLADVGGGRGYLLATILERYPELKGILLDLPHVVAGATPLLREHGVAGGSPHSAELSPRTVERRACPRRRGRGAAPRSTGLGETPRPRDADPDPARPRTHRGGVREALRRGRLPIHTHRADSLAGMRRRGQMGLKRSPASRGDLPVATSNHPG